MPQGDQTPSPGRPARRTSLAVGKVIRPFLIASGLSLVVTGGAWVLFANGTARYADAPGSSEVLRASLAWLYSWAALFPWVRRVALRFPLSAGAWGRAALAHLVALVGFALLGHLICSVVLWLFRVVPSPVPSSSDTFVLGLLAYGSLSAAVQIKAEREQRHESQAAFDTLRRQLAEARLEALVRQLHPHFLFNALHAVSAFVSSDPERAEDMLEELADLLRASLDQRGDATVPLAEELDLAQKYVRIQQARLGHRLRVERSIDDASLAGFVPPLVMQPLIENAVEHGIARLEDGGVLQLTTEKRGDILHLEVSNPAPPGDGPLNSGLGIGLANVRERLASLYGARASVEFSREASTGLATCTVRLPWTTNASGGK